MPDPEALKILFVDDEPDLVPLIRQKFRSQVRSGELALVFAADGVEALDQLEADPDIDIVVTDINMPRMDGLTLLGRLGELGRPTKAVVVTAYGDMENIRTAMNRGAFDFLTKPIDMADLDVTLGQARGAVEREREAERVRRTITRYLSDKIANAVLSNPDAVQASERREVSVLMSDIAGFSQVAERLEPERVVELLNVYLGAMTEVVDEHDGAIDEFIGDAVLAIFGAPLEMADHAARAVACAVAMQARMGDVNADLAERGLPALEMTAAVNSGEVVVGTIGSETRAKYGVVGSPVNLTARIQSLAVPGEVLISDATYAAAGGADGPLRLDGTRRVSLKGFAEPVAVHSVAAVEGAGAVPADESSLRDLADPLPFRLATLDGKRLAADAHDGALVALAETGARARVAAQAEVEPRTDVCLSLDLPGGTVDVYAKVTEVEDVGDGQALGLRFSSVPPEAAEAFAARS
ncbi:adenylate/guanylate cyclase domain-containing protein [Rubrivirga sp. S365]|uniref:Adenylate/guanylate cyclase domain-containing protein n=1 Tax=Rubrivirga litoralis TaxID=3075598 RepID=A0ABU3BQ15_9BACT|nr:MULTISPECIES: adenylate/guanylate cyclase domain-containing protein [unclassified Rubrivirga]MDT0631382.1 adenylate/guanylate cyclase domain-containing protein [Rubrivirga sp. F394]MDT7855973.1 adenylate/guanylate cyclase domain-containing protein [Rubrivirga sp. S365]